MVLPLIVLKLRLDFKGSKMGQCCAEEDQCKNCNISPLDDEAQSIVSVGRRHFAASFNYQLLTLAQKSAKLWAHFSEPCITETLKGG